MEHKMTTEHNCQLYFLGVGPGDPELLTLKAVRIIQDCDIMFVPVTKKKRTGFNEGTK
jgi:Precorrin-2 methylase